MPNTSTTSQIDSQNEKLANNFGERDTNSVEKNAKLVTDKADGAIKSMTSAVQEKSGKLVDDARDYAESGTRMAKEAYHDVEETVKEKSDALAEYIKAQPIKSALMAAGAGYFLSYLCRK